MTKLVGRSIPFGAVLFTAVVSVGCTSEGTDVGVAGAAGNTVGTVVNDPPMTCAATTTGTAGASFGMAPGLSPRLGATKTLPDAPPAISGGTLRLLADGVTAVAADPDRDQVYVVNLQSRAVTATIKLNKGDEPGRIVADAAGLVHVALRHGGAVVSIDPAAGTVTARRDVCAAPRGIAFDPATKLLHVACADGQLVSLPAAGGDVTRRLTLASDLRDVIVDGDQLQVTRFRAAELLTVDASGQMMGSVAPPPFRSLASRAGQLYTPSVAWRTLPMPSGGVAMLHQRGLSDEVQATVGGYGGFSPCDAIVQTTVTTMLPGQDPQTGPALAGMVLAVDMDISADGKRVAIVSAGNATNSEADGAPARLPRVFVTDMTAASDTIIGCSGDGTHAPCLPLGVGVTNGPVIDDTSATDGGVATPTPTPSIPALPTTCASDPSVGDQTIPDVVGQPIAVAFMASGDVVVQSREPAVLSLPGGAPITLSTVSRDDTGHDIFHSNAGGFIACASCHAEGNDDARVWRFACEGARRTQSLQVGLRGTEPFHWGGDEKTFPQLVGDVFVGRMSGPQLADDQIGATLSWIDAQPRLARAPIVTTASTERGRVLFNDPKTAGCATCHNGPSLTNNTTVDVGTGGMFQVASLVGVSTRGPFMHNGCATTLRDRFGACGGGDKHGVTSKLTSTQLDDLLAYLGTL